MDIIALNTDIEQRNQFPQKPNLLTQELITATSFDTKQALKLQSSVCKAITFWFEAKHKSLLDMDFASYYKHCIDNNYIRKEDAWINLEFGYSNGILKTEYADKFNIGVSGCPDYKSFIEWSKSQTEFLGTLRIVSKTGGKHSLICYKKADKIFISDTSSRGIASPFDVYITSMNFIYFTSLKAK